MVEYTCIYQKSMQNVERGKAFASSSLTLHFMLLHMKCNAGVLAQQTAQFDDWEKERDGQRDANFMLSGRRDRHRCSGILAAAKEKMVPGFALSDHKGYDHC